MVRLLTDEQGLTLSEVIVAITILGVAVIGLMGMFSTSQITYVDAGKETIALNLAQQEIEETKSKAWNQITTKGWESFPSPFQKYRYRVVVVTEGNIKTITVDVQYKIGDNIKTVSLTTTVSLR